MTEAANITTLRSGRKSFEDALREIEDPLWRTRGMLAALRLVTLTKGYDRTKGEFHEAVTALQYTLEELANEMQASFDTAFAPREAADGEIEEAAK